MSLSLSLTLSLALNVLPLSLYHSPHLSQTPLSLSLTPSLPGLPIFSLSVNKIETVTHVAPVFLEQEDKSQYKVNPVYLVLNDMSSRHARLPGNSQVVWRHRGQSSSG